MTASALKLLAMFLMLLDHIGYTFISELPGPAYVVLRVLGRIAFPLFCLMIAEGLYHTRDARRYLLRLALFAVASEIPYDLFVSGQWLNWGRQSVGVTLFLGLLGILLYDSFAARGQKSSALLAIVATACLAQLAGADYGMFGVYYIFIFYYFRGQVRPLAAALSVGVVLYMAMFYLRTFSLEWPLIALGTLGALIPAALYSGRPGRLRGPAARWCLYAFYPAHMMVLWAAKLAILGI